MIIRDDMWLQICSWVRYHGMSFLLGWHHGPHRSLGRRMGWVHRNYQIHWKVTRFKPLKLLLHISGLVCGGCAKNALIKGDRYLEPGHLFMQLCVRCSLFFEKHLKARTYKMGHMFKVLTWKEYIPLLEAFFPAFLSVHSLVPPFCPIIHTSNGNEHSSKYYGSWTENTGRNFCCWQLIGMVQCFHAIVNGWLNFNVEGFSISEHQHFQVSKIPENAR